MDSMNNICRDYFNGYHDLFTPGKRHIGVALCLSYVTLIIPFIMLAALKLSEDPNRINILPPEISSKVTKVASQKPPFNGVNQENPTTPTLSQISLGNHRVILNKPSQTTTSAPQQIPSPQLPTENSHKIITRNFGKDYPLLNVSQHKELPPQKIIIIEKAKENYKKLGLKPHVELLQLESYADFYITKEAMPTYFYSTINKPIMPTINYTPEFFNYAIHDPSKEEIWVDFANMWLGGGVLNEGNVQEETMAQETPELLALCADYDPVTGYTYATRTGPANTGEQVLGASPSPILIKGLQRVLALDSDKLYGGKLYHVTEDALRKNYGITILDKAVRFNTLAIAAPRLSFYSEQFHIDTLKDLFNTMIAGFTLSGKNTLIHSGLIGCGAFNHHYRAAIVIQMFAAAITNTSLMLHGVDSKKMEEANAVWQLAFGDKAPNQFTVEEGLQSIEDALNHFQPA